MSTLKNGVAVITGAANGIGRALALRLAAEGAHLALADLEEAGLIGVARELAGRGIEISTHVVDVADEKRVGEFAAEVLSRHGRVTALFNNAGVALHGDVEEVSLADVEWLMGINFWGVLYGIKHFLPILKQQDRAYVVNLSSVFGLIAPPGQAAYAASKFAVRGFTEALRHELKGTNVQVATVHPGGIKTEIAKRARMGALADQAKYEMETARFERLSRITPDRAADRIVKGMLRGETRILVGRDASQIDLIQRLMPTRYWRLLGPLVDWRTRR
ncbi:MAG: SDR family NAD(P)-dependent oxidoreductase [Pyrinomonadaceae bacterium]